MNVLRPWMPKGFLEPSRVRIGARSLPEGRYAAAFAGSPGRKRKVSARGPSRPRPRGYRLGLFWAAALLLPVSGPVAGDEWYAVPNVSQRLLWDDNRRLTARDHSSVWGSITTLGGELGWRTPLVDFSLTPRFVFERYDGDSDLNGNDVYLDAQLARAYERSRLSLELGYARDHVLTSEVDDTAVLRGDNDPRTSWRVVPRWSHSLTERDTIDTGVSYRDVSYEEGLRSGRVDFTYTVADLGLRRQLSARDSLSGVLYVSRYDADQTRSTTDSVGFQAGYTRAFSETLTGNVAVGPIYSKFKRGPVLAASTESEDTGLLLNASLSRQLERTRWELNASRALTPTGDGFLSERTELSMELDHELQPRLRGRLAARAYSDEAPTAAGRRLDRDHLRLEAGLRYRLTPYWTLSGQYVYRERENEQEIGAVDSSAESNAVFFTLGYSGERRSVSR